MRIYVGNLPFELDDAALRAMFSPHGEIVEVKVMMDHGHEGRSRGFAFVEMETDEATAAAIAALNGTDSGGRELKVSEARPPKVRRSEEDIPSGRGGRRF